MILLYLFVISIRITVGVHVLRKLGSRKMGSDLIYCFMVGFNSLSDFHVCDPPGTFWNPQGAHALNLRWR